jgi:hypothetical protein
MTLVRIFLLLLAGLTFGAPALAGGLPPVQTVFVVLFENHTWLDFKGSADAPYINQVLLPMASYCEQYYNPPGLHPSLPNYIWLESGTNFGIFDDNGPAADHLSATNHLVTLLRNAGIPWKAYAEDIDGTFLPLDNTNAFAVRHVPFLYFDDVTGTNDPACAYAIAHIRPYGELIGDLTNHTVARYNFIIPNLCNDGHDSCPPLANPVMQTDAWLAGAIPNILNSQAYQDRGAIFLLWDEGEGGSDGPIPAILLSPLARGGGYSSQTHYTHSSTLRTLQEIFGVTPLLGDAAAANDLADLFSQFAVTDAVRLTNGGFQFTATGLIPGRTNLIQRSPNLADWTAISTNVSYSNTLIFVDGPIDRAGKRYYRVLRLP